MKCLPFRESTIPKRKIKIEIDEGDESIKIKVTFGLAVVNVEQEAYEKIEIVFSTVLGDSTGIYFAVDFAYGFDRSTGSVKCSTDRKSTRLNTSHMA